jgi:catechol 2,3-dioxygenase-like lactoylglutathione lyase family enzyme
MQEAAIIVRRSLLVPPRRSDPVTMPAPPRVDCDHVHPGHAVGDLHAAIDFYTTRLGFTLGFTWGEPPVTAGVDLGEVRVFLQRGTPSPEGSEIFFVVGDADELFAFHQAAGVEIVEPIADREYGMRDYRVRDLDGYPLAFGHYVYDAGEPVPIERVNVPVRMEKRLAALVHDLAAHKRTTVDGLLEEILLHTCEPAGDGVASPHTRAQLRRIQELKVKHGIDYDTHASYRFVERAAPHD